MRKSKLPLSLLNERAQVWMIFQLFMKLSYPHKITEPTWNKFEKICHLCTEFVLCLCFVHVKSLSSSTVLCGHTVCEETACWFISEHYVYVLFPQLCNVLFTKAARVHILDTESFGDTFGPKSQRKKPNLKVGDMQVCIRITSKRMGPTVCSSRPKIRTMPTHCVTRLCLWHLNLVCHLIIEGAHATRA